MVELNSIKKELSKLNSELEKYVPYASLNYSNLKSLNQLNDSQASNIEILTFLQDVRDELSLLRKHAFNDIESLVTKKLHTQQDEFLSKIRQTFERLSQDLIASRNAQSRQILEQLESINHELTNQSLEIKSIHQKIDNMQEEVYSSQYQMFKQISEVENSLNSSIDHINLPVQSNSQQNTQKFITTFSSEREDSDNFEEEIIKTRIDRINSALSRLQ
ncbi:MAG: hypothetical protein ACLFPL_00375 [Candidatus Nanoarchaeia archaeon]